MAPQALPKLHWQGLLAAKQPRAEPTRRPLWGAMLLKFQELKLKPQNVTDLKRRCRLSGAICLMKQFAKLFWAFANYSWHASKLKADIRTFAHLVLNNFYPPFARRAKGEVFVLLYVCLFVRPTISQQPAGRFTPYFACGRSLGRDVSSPLLGVGDPPGAKRGKMTWGWSHSCIGQLPFLFFSAMPNVVQYVGHRPAHILV